MTKNPKGNKLKHKTISFKNIKNNSKNSISRTQKV